MPSKSNILGFEVDSVDWNDIQSFARTALDQNQPKHIVTINGEIILQALKNPALSAAIKAAHLVIPDSTNVFWVSRWKGAPLKMITPGSDLVWHLCRLAAEINKSVFLLGAKEGIAQKAATVLQQQIPGLVIAGTSSANPDNQEILEEITNSRADIVLIAYGPPAQEIWINQNMNKLGAKILVGIGGTFDMIAGVLPRAPKAMRALHLEWLWRLILQPSRIGRIWNAVVVFPFKALVN